MSATAGRVIVITGGGSELAQALAKKVIAEDDSTIVLFGYRNRRPRAVNSDRVVPFQADLSTVAGEERLRAAIESLPPVPLSGVLAHGYFPGFARLDQISCDDTGRLLRDNCLSVMRALSVMLPQIAARGGGHVVLFGSHATGQGYPFLGGFSAAKAFLNELGAVIASEWGVRGVCSTVYALGTLDTAYERELLPMRDPQDWLPPDVVAQVVWERLQTRGTHTTGAVIPLFKPTGVRHSMSYFERIGRSL